MKLFNHKVTSSGHQNRKCFFEETFQCQWLCMIAMGDKVVEKVNIKAQERIIKKAESYLQSDLVKKNSFFLKYLCLIFAIKKVFILQVFFPINPSKNHWYVGVLNMSLKEFQILNSLMLSSEDYTEATRSLVISY